MPERQCNRNLDVLLIHTTYSKNNMSQKFEGICCLWVLNEMIKNIYLANLKVQPNLSGNGLDWLCYLAGNS